MHTLSCVRCGKVLRPVQDAQDCYQPYGGIICTSSGNYGSTRFDPIALEERGNELLFFLCDECLVERKDAMYLLRAKRKNPIPATNYIRG
jgi:hypothetical protein